MHSCVGSFFYVKSLVITSRKGSQKSNRTQKGHNILHMCFI
nr:MAG TPA: hypothetical protein [Bacteriophage sp.]